MGAVPNEPTQKPTKMIFGQVSKTVARRFSTTVARRSQEWQQYGVPGSNLPFDINNRYKLCALFTLFFGSGLAAPFLIVRRHLLLAKQAQSVTDVVECMWLMMNA